MLHPTVQNKMPKPQPRSVVVSDRNTKRDMKGDEEFETLLDEIPHATSHNLRQHHDHQNNLHHHIANNFNGGDGTESFATPTRTNRGLCGDEQSSVHCKYGCPSPVSGFSLSSDGSSSSLFSNGQSISERGSSTPRSLEDLNKSYVCSGNSQNSDRLGLDCKVPDSDIRRNGDRNLIDELGLGRTLDRMHLTAEQRAAFNLRDIPPNFIRRRFRDQINGDPHVPSCYLNNGFSDQMSFQSSVRRTTKNFDAEKHMTFRGLQQQYGVNGIVGPRMPSGSWDAFLSQQDLNCYNGPVNSPWQKTEEQMSNYQYRGGLVSNVATLNNFSMADDMIYWQRNKLNLNEERNLLYHPNPPQMTPPRSHLRVENLLQCGVPLSSGMAKVPSNNRILTPGEGLNYVTNKGQNFSRAHSKSVLNDIGMSNRLERRPQLSNQPQMIGSFGNARGTKLCSPFTLPPKHNSLPEARGSIYLTAMDQNGCRFLQRMFDEGTQQDVQIIFNEIIGHIVELMVNPFGNYLMQKLLEVCTEEQRTQILLMAAEKPGQLVQISLNTHGTRVVQKLIETLKTRQQVALVISALEPGFLSLIKDLNGNHVIQRCLHCLLDEDNKFIFVAAAKYCIDIATHQHGCCVLQRCISHSNGEYQEKLVAEISTSGLLLAQDAYGNYVVQFILELQIPSAISNLITQFEGNYVHLSSQKFSSHVVEKCLLVFNTDTRARIIRELLSSSQFEQLLQDPHANYVVQTALRVSEGSLRDSLVEAIEAHKSASRNSPYSKRIFSQKMLRK